MLNLEPKDPKIFPLIPIAPGIITIRPGYVFKKNSIFPKIIPAHKSPTAQMERAIKLSFKTASVSAKNSLIYPTKRAGSETMNLTPLNKNRIKLTTNVIVDSPN